MEEKNVERIAKQIVAKMGIGDSVSDMINYYSEANSLILVVRRINKIFLNMTGGIGKYNKNISSLNILLNTMKSLNISRLGTSEASSTYSDYLKTIKSLYDKCISSSEEEKQSAENNYSLSVKQALEYSRSFEAASADAIAATINGDENNIKSLLNTISALRTVLNPSIKRSTDPINESVYEINESVYENNGASEEMWKSQFNPGGNRGNLSNSVNVNAPSEDYSKAASLKDDDK